MANLSIPKDLSSEAVNKYILDVWQRFDVKCPPSHTTTQFVQLIGHFLKETLIHPTFIINHLEVMSPMAK
ncbi:unnamed protein product, partial [Vitis vinifera]|uniref:Uncharacterized protein n=1 Tax=Vitis vinifera TaxID=29760 RepID=D7U7A7_VITVI